uniref:Uncharacterized protein n=1 Tax=Leersia perrieri TaxID=77586 RepID=A0A0D9WK79_9ORYZ
MAVVPPSKPWGRKRAGKLAADQLGWVGSAAAAPLTTGGGKRVGVGERARRAHLGTGVLAGGGEGARVVMGRVSWIYMFVVTAGERTECTVGESGSDPLRREGLKDVPWFVRPRDRWLKPFQGFGRKRMEARNVVTEFGL